MFQSEPLVQQDNTNSNSWVKPRPVDLPGGLEIGTTATTAAAGNHDHAVEADPDVGLAAAATIQELAAALSARIKALEDAAV